MDANPPKLCLLTVTGIADSPDRQPAKFSGLRQYHVKRVRGFGVVRGVVGFNKNFKMARAMDLKTLYQDDTMEIVIVELEHGNFFELRYYKNQYQSQRNASLKTLLKQALMSDERMKRIYQFIMNKPF